MEGGRREVEGDGRKKRRSYSETVKNNKKESLVIVKPRTGIRY